MTDDKKLSEWHGVPRKKIKWNPKVNYEKCVRCVTCSNTCLKDAISFPDKEYVRKVIRENKVLTKSIKDQIQIHEGAERGLRLLFAPQMLR